MVSLGVPVRALAIFVLAASALAGAVSYGRPLWTEGGIPLVNGVTDVAWKAFDVASDGSGGLMVAMPENNRPKLKHIQSDGSLAWNATVNGVDRGCIGGMEVVPSGSDFIVFWMVGAPAACAGASGIYSQRISGASGTTLGLAANLGGVFYLSPIQKTAVAIPGGAIIIYSGAGQVIKFSRVADDGTVAYLERAVVPTWDTGAGFQAISVADGVLLAYSAAGSLKVDKYDFNGAFVWSTPVHAGASQKMFSSDGSGGAVIGFVAGSNSGYAHVTSAGTLVEHQYSSDGTNGANAIMTNNPGEIARAWWFGSSNKALNYYSPVTGTKNLDNAYSGLVGWSDGAFIATDGQSNGGRLGQFVAYQYFPQSNPSCGNPNGNNIAVAVKRIKGNGEAWGDWADLNAGRLTVSLSYGYSASRQPDSIIIVPAGAGSAIVVWREPSSTSVFLRWYAQKVGGDAATPFVPKNALPVVSAGGPYTTGLSQDITMSTATVSDPNGYGMSNYDWSWYSGPGSCWFTPWNQAFQPAVACSSYGLRRIQFRARNSMGMWSIPACTDFNVLKGECSICNADSECASGHCRTAFGTTTRRCAPDATSCVINLDSACTLPDGYKNCVTGIQYQQCNSGVWGTPVNCNSAVESRGCNPGVTPSRFDHPEPPNYCGYQQRTAESCQSGTGCAAMAWPACGNCNPHIAASTYTTCGSNLAACDQGCGAACDQDTDCPGSAGYCSGSIWFNAQPSLGCNGASCACNPLGSSSTCAEAIAGPPGNNCPGWQCDAASDCTPPSNGCYGTPSLYRVYSPACNGCHCGSSYVNNCPLTKAICDPTACSVAADCANQCSGTKIYSTYSCTPGTCSCSLSNPLCDVTTCGAECDATHQCPSMGACSSSCTCSGGLGSLAIDADSGLYYADNIPRGETLRLVCKRPDLVTIFNCAELGPVTVTWEREGFRSLPGRYLGDPGLSFAAGTFTTLTGAGFTAAFTHQSDESTTSSGTIFATIGTVTGSRFIDAPAYSLEFSPNLAYLGHGVIQNFVVSCKRADNGALITPCPPVPPGAIIWGLTHVSGGPLDGIALQLTANSVQYTAPNNDVDVLLTGSVGISTGSAQIFVRIPVIPSVPIQPAGQPASVLMLSCPRMTGANETNVTLQCLNASSGGACDSSQILLTGAPNALWGRVGSIGFIYTVDTRIEGDYNLLATVAGMGESGCKMARVGGNASAVPDVNPVLAVAIAACALLIARRRRGL